MNLPNFSELPTPLRVREFTPSDFDACTQIYRSNLADFLPDALELLQDHLENGFSYFLIIESAGAVLACGGLDISGDTDVAGFTFGMVRRDMHRRGLGTLLAWTRLALLDEEHDPVLVELETTLAVEPFYQRLGFERVSTPELRYSGGSYYVSMERAVTMQERDVLRAELARLPVTFDLEFHKAPPRN